MKTNETLKIRRGPFTGSDPVAAMYQDATGVRIL